MTGCLIDRELVVFFVLSLFFSLFFVLGCPPAGGIVILHDACKCCTCSEGMGSETVHMLKRAGNIAGEKTNHGR